MNTERTTPQTVGEEHPQDAWQERVVSAAVDKILAVIGPLRARLQEEALQKALENVQSERPDEQVPRLRLDKADGELKRVVAWLLKADARAKLTAVLSHWLLSHEGELKESGRYKGDIGNELMWDWEAEIADQQSASPPENEETWIRGYTAALMSIQG